MDCEAANLVRNGRICKNVNFTGQQKIDLELHEFVYT